ncbi:roadblock/LC7 domain-containing protein [Streptomyces paromomycinus]|uniref:Dynein regulation protein LC7 n=1 Tax=Streptomyces paromomycinus TaxID=92743 RepID=A0A401VXL9_STREY|nr:roadblock/LC7 domain-containing protein [Streptomyces paromomycinus]GCD41781.1 dynein regulation protein LC7 [Streptomyces paromomycinus]
MSTPDLAWLMTQLRNDLPGCHNVLLTSSDGLLRASDEHFERGKAETLAALCSSLVSSSLAFGKLYDEGRSLRTVVIDLKRHQLAVVNAGAGSILAVVADADADPAMIGTAMMQMVEKLAEHLGTAARAPERTSS